MKNFKTIWNSASSAVCRAGGDKWCHALFGLLIAFAAGALVARAEPNPGEALSFTGLLSAAGAGVVLATVLGFAKECVDALAAPRPEDEASRWDVGDWLATICGGVVGGLLLLLGAWALA